MSDDNISRHAAIETLDRFNVFGYVEEPWEKLMDALQALPAGQPKWIPIKTRPMTDEEIEYYAEHYGYDVEGDWAVMFDCPMPEDGQEVWVCFKSGYVAEDVCDNDDVMIGLEGNGDWDDVVAWMPKIRPEPYKGEE